LVLTTGHFQLAVLKIFRGMSFEDMTGIDESRTCRNLPPLFLAHKAILAVAPAYKLVVD
jgi:hypothetical protein